MMLMKFGLRAVTCLLMLLCCSAGAADYYFDSAGNDANDGRSPATAWRTTTNASTFAFAAGDRLLFAGGQTFLGGIFLGPNSGGSSTNPLVITSYGNGRAIINGQTTNAITITNRAGIIVSNINAVGNGSSSNTGDGIAFYSTLSGTPKLPLIIVDHVESSGFGGAGICFVSWNGQSGFRDAYVLNSSTHDNGGAGLLTYAEQPNTHSNFYFGLCKFYNNSGEISKQGAGIVLGEMTHATVEFCVAHDNGRRAQKQGPVGFWTYDSSFITFQCNESYSNRENTGYDGGGFDLDENTRNSVMQYNYSHDNNGPGYLLCCDLLTTSNVVRFNISQNDCRNVHAGAIHSFINSRDLSNVPDTYIYNNSVFLTPNGAFPMALMLFGATKNYHLFNNIFQTTGGARIAWIGDNQSNLFMLNNDYWSGTNQFSIVDSGVEYTNLASWRSASGRETFNGNSFGFNVDPQFKNAGNGQTLDDATLLGAVTAYDLRATSPMIDAGLDLRALFGLEIGPHDFKRTIIPQGDGFDLGANELIWSRVLKFSGINWNAGKTTLSIVGPLQRTNVLESSADLVSWRAVYTWVNTDGTTNIVDANAFNPLVVYRARELP